MILGAIRRASSVAFLLSLTNPFGMAILKTVHKRAKKMEEIIEWIRVSFDSVILFRSVVCREDWLSSLTDTICTALDTGGPIDNHAINSECIAS